MSVTEHSTVVGVFTARDQADRAINDLRRLGFTDEQIGFVTRHAGADGATGDTTGGRVATGAVGGGLVGGILGAAASLLIPGFGPAIAGGILAATLGGLAIGATGGIIGSLTHIGVSEEDARYYQGEFEAGHVIVTVKAAGRQQEALTVLRNNGAYDASTRDGIHKHAL